MPPACLQLPDLTPCPEPPACSSLDLLGQISRLPGHSLTLALGCSPGLGLSPRFDPCPRVTAHAPVCPTAVPQCGGAGWQGPGEREGQGSHRQWGHRSDFPKSTESS